MNTRIITTGFFCAASYFSLLVCCAHAALPIDLEVAKEAGVPLAAPQEWARTLGRMNLGSVRLRDARVGERPQVEQVKLGNSPRYRVLAILTGRNELVLPSRRFRTSDRAAMQKYFEQLPVQAAHNAEDRGRFGLTKKQFKRVYAELSEPVGFSTKGATAKEILRLAEKRVSTPLQMEFTPEFSSNNPVTAELKNLTLGTVLAYALRREGMIFVPEQLPGQELRIVVTRHNAKKESWPIGWKPAVSSRQSAPQLFESRSIEIQGFTLIQALNALQPALQIPVVMDDWIIARRDIKPSEVQVVLPKKRTFLKSAVRKLLSQAKLSEELRVDELEQPFLWITRFGKDSPMAYK